MPIDTKTPLIYFPKPVVRSRRYCQLDIWFDDNTSTVYWVPVYIEQAIWIDHKRRMFKDAEALMAYSDVLRSFQRGKNV